MVCRALCKLLVGDGLCRHVTLLRAVSFPRYFVFQEVGYNLT
jgi:hypothetical protein